MKLSNNIWAQFKNPTKKLSIDFNSQVIKALRQEEMFINLTKEETSRFLSKAPMGTYLFQFGEIPENLIFALRMFDKVNYYSFSIIKDNEKLSFKGSKNTYLDLNDLITRSSVFFNEQLRICIENAINETIKKLDEITLGCKERVSKIRNLLNVSLPDDISNNDLEIFMSINSIIKSGDLLPKNTNDLKKKLGELQTIQEKIAESILQQSSILQPYMKWIKGNFLNNKDSPIEWPLELFIRILENIYIHHLKEMEGEKILGISKDLILLVIEAGRLFKIDVRFQAVEVQKLLICHELYRRCDGFSDQAIAEMLEDAPNLLALLPLGDLESESDTTADLSSKLNLSSPK